MTESNQPLSGTPLNRRQFLTRRFVEDAEAKRLRSRAMRAPWQV